MLANRTGSVGDVLLDLLGALVAILSARLGWRRAAEAATGALLWIAAVAGLGALALGLAAGGRRGAAALSLAEERLAHLMLHRLGELLAASPVGAERRIPGEPGQPLTQGDHVPNDDHHRRRKMDGLRQTG